MPAASAAAPSPRPARPEPAFSSLPELASTFVLRAQTRNYNHQYANMYFARLVQLRAAVQAEAERKWAKAAGASSSVPSRSLLELKSKPSFSSIGQPKLVDRVLDVQQGQLCYILGTVYMDMPLKPNVLEDITKDVCPLSRSLRLASAWHVLASAPIDALPCPCCSFAHSRQKWIVAPPPRQKFFSDEDTVVLEDESGRVQLVGSRLASETLVTGTCCSCSGRTYLCSPRVIRCRQSALSCSDATLFLPLRTRLPPFTVYRRHPRRARLRIVRRRL